MSKLSKISLIFGIIFLTSFLTMHVLIYSGKLVVTDDVIDYSFFNKIFILISVGVFIFEYVKKNKQLAITSNYVKNLNNVLISQSHNPLFYDGDVVNGSKILTKEVCDSTNVDRCSIWLYSKNKTSIVCQQLYSKLENEYQSGFELFNYDYHEYFLALLTSQVIVANDAETHYATSCFLEPYLKPLGIKSMLDVPIFYDNEVIGVICLESFKKRDWCESEINFATILSSLYSFAYSVKKTNDTKKTLSNFERFVDSSVLVSKTDKFGKITYVNKKFTEVSGWSFEDAIGKDHHILNSGKQPNSFWKKMYKKTVTDKEIWNEVVINKRKDGKYYYVDTYITAIFNNDTDELEGFMSIRQDVTELYEKLNEISEKNTYLEHAAKILRHDMHSGINTYIPRGLNSLERRITPEIILKFKLDVPLKILREGLSHAQKVYQGVYEFTNLVKKGSKISKQKLNLKEIITNFLSSTAYSSQVVIDDLPTVNVNESLFCTAIDNLIRNGLKYNDSETKMVKLYMEDNTTLCIQDNGRGLTQSEFDRLSRPYTRKRGQKEQGSGLGLNICTSILKEHGFSIKCDSYGKGTLIKIKLK